VLPSRHNYIITQW